VIASAGDGSLYPGGNLAHLNFMEPHLITVLNFIGLSDISFVRVGYEEYKDDRFKQSWLLLNWRWMN
jgi:FMN-dependent NADH-azoreductase